jgi:hypothetical protein
MRVHRKHRAIEIAVAERKKRERALRNIIEHAAGFLQTTGLLNEKMTANKCRAQQLQQHKKTINTEHIQAHV